MRSGRLAPLLIAFGLALPAVIGCNDDRGNDDENADTGSSESAEATTTSGGDMSCIPGELGCECNGGLCLGDLVCIEEVCTSPSDTSEADSESSSSTESGCWPFELDCGGNCIDPLTDNENCGGCGNVCNVEGEYGECVDGECTPTLSDCISWESPTPCEDVCSAAGMICAPMGCSGATYIYYDGPSACARHLTRGGSADPCTEPSFAATGSYRCCCAQR